MTQDKKISVGMMLAMDKNKLIGKDNDMPWHIPGEQAYFKQVTMGKPIIMGRKTYESIGRPLPGRANIVVTRNPEWSADGVVVVSSLSEAIDLAAQLAGEEVDEVMIIGGATLCREAMPITERVYLTYIDYAYEGDTYFDSFNWSDWQELSRQDNQHEGLAYSYFVLERAGT